MPCAGAIESDAPASVVSRPILLVPAGCRDRPVTIATTSNIHSDSAADSSPNSLAVGGGEGASSAGSSTMLVSVIVPCRNEIDHLESFLEALDRQRLEGLEVEFLIADGRSDDGTREILDRRAAVDPRLRVLDNVRRRIAPALNLAIRAARGEVVVRMDVHTRYPDDYIARCVRVLAATGADNVGGPWLARGETPFERAAAAVFPTRLASGGAACRRPDLDGPVESVYLGCWRRSAFERFGLFDESLGGNEDDEFNLRTRRQGGVVRGSAEIRCWYRPRPNALALFGQHVGYGRWKVGVMRRHPTRIAWRRLAPAALVLALAISLSLAAWVPLLLAIPVAYLLAIVVGTGVVAFRSNMPRSWPSMIVAVLAMHLGYGVGTLLGSVRPSRVADPGPKSASETVARAVIDGSVA
jgi:succinoglycan biosynthesis protein ExoA